jgi:aminopeptidase N
MKQRLLLAAACTVCITTASAQQLPDVLRPGNFVPVESKHLCSHALHTTEAELAIDKPSVVVRRNYDVLEYNLYMDWTNPLSTQGTGAADRRYSGVNRITVRIDSANVTDLVFDAAAMKIDSVSIDPPRAITIQQPINGKEVTIKADTPFQQGETVTLAISYTITSAVDEGFYLFAKGQDTEPLPNGLQAEVEERLAYTMSEPTDARYWMPCNDRSYDKAMSSIAIRVPKPFSVAANGLLQEIVDEQDGTQTYHWKSFSPMATYLMHAAASIFTQYQDWYHRVSNPADSIPVQYFVWKADYDETRTDRSSYNARNSFRHTVRMMEAFSTLYTEYPFEKYGMVAVQPFDFGGMEHQTMTTVNRNWLRTADQPGIAHELMHQWTGDLVTCASFDDIWLNEGGATFGEALWAEVDGGANGYLNTMLEKRLWYLYSPTNDIPIYAPAKTSSIFNYATTYAKAGWVYHMLRQMLGDDVFFPTMRKYHGVCLYLYRNTGYGELFRAGSAELSRTVCYLFRTVDL